jgi:hypothetical protein|tara:strand:+ start:3367 stop:3657 length:291 start_codon:yes stop_codon:yes gene_type:complete
MKTKTLKLTKSESKLFDKSTENTPLGKLLTMIIFKGNGVVEFDVDKFRNFLNDEIEKANNEYNKKIKDNRNWNLREICVRYSNFKSILSKLDQEVK